MSFHLLNYFVSAGAGDANVDMTAAVDSEFSRRNSHYIFSERYNLILAAHLAVSATRARFNVPTWNAIARQQIWPVNRSATPPSYPRVMDLRDYPMEIPMNEEIAVEESNDLAMGNEDTTAFLWIAPPTWNRNLPRGEMPIMVRATGAVARTADSWSADGAITFAENLRGGVYGVIGVHCQSANLRAFRLNFIRAPVINGRKFRPGSLVTNAVGNIDDPLRVGNLGLWGYFHTFEPPQLQVYGDAAGADTQELRLALVYMGERFSGY